MRSRSRRVVRSRRIANSARDAQLVAESQAFHLEKCAGEVQRRRQPSAAQHRRAPARLQKVELTMEADAVSDAQPRIEIEQVDATPQQDVLAVVDSRRVAFARRHRIGSGTPAEKRPRFEQLDREPRAAERRRRGETRQSAAGDQNLGHMRLVLRPGVSEPLMKLLQSISIPFSHW